VVPIQWHRIFVIRVWIVYEPGAVLTPARVSAADAGGAISVCW